jgi:hypothetical protein
VLTGANLEHIVIISIDKDGFFDGIWLVICIKYLSAIAHNYLFFGNKLYNFWPV